MSNDGIKAFVRAWRRDVRAQHLAKIGGSGCIKYVQRNRVTGTTTGAYDAAAQGIEADPALPWAAVCWTHGNCVCDPRKTAVLYMASHPDEFCGDCMDADDDDE